MKALIGYIEKFLEWGTILTLVAISLVVGIQIIGRYIFKETPFWTEETARFLFIYLIMFGAGLAVRHKAYVNLDVITNLLPAKVQTFLMLVVNVIIAAFMVVFLKHSLTLIERVSMQKSPVLQIAMSYPYAAMLGIGGSILLFVVIDSWEIIAGTARGGESR